VAAAVKECEQLHGGGNKQAPPAGLREDATDTGVDKQSVDLLGGKRLLSLPSLCRSCECDI